MKAERFDVVVIGAGQAGPPLAQSLTKAGRKVALVEREHLGGSCVNFGCTPSKAVIASAHVAHMARRAGDFGVRVERVEPDFAAVIARAREIVQNSRESLQKSYGGDEGPELIRGHGRIDGKDGGRYVVAVGERRLSCEHVVLDTGTRTRMPDIGGLDGIDYLCAENWLEHDTLARHLAIVGAGYIGLEMAQFYRRMGAEVTVIGSGSQIAEHEDKDVADALQQLLEREGIRFLLNSKPGSVSRKGDQLDLQIDGEGGAKPAVPSVQASHLFIATGRAPNTQGMGLEELGVKLDQRGHVEVDERLQTTCAGIWAVGDIRGGPQFTHTSWDDYRIVECQMLGDGHRTTDRVVPYALFTDPELGRVGLTESQAREKGMDIETKRFELKHNGRARESGETAGFIKLVLEKGTRQIVGAAVLGHAGSELVHIYVALMNAKASAQVLEDAIQIHPTFAEAIQSAVSAE